MSCPPSSFPHPVFARPIALGGFWLESIDSKTAYPCPGGVEACPEKGLQCGAGYSGPLCGVCEPGYQPSRDGELTLCKSCPEVTVTYTWLALGIPSALFLLCLFVENTLITADKTDNKSSVYSKILLNSLQFLGMAATLPYQWPGAVVHIIEAQVGGSVFD